MIEWVIKSKRGWETHKKGGRVPLLLQLSPKPRPADVPNGSRIAKEDPNLPHANDGEPQEYDA